MKRDERSRKQPNNDKDLLIKGLKQAVDERLTDRSIILSKQEQEMLVWFCKYFAAESEEERNQVAKELHPGHQWDRGFIMEFLDRLNKLRHNQITLPVT